MYVFISGKFRRKYGFPKAIETTGLSPIITSFITLNPASGNPIEFFAPERTRANSPRITTSAFLIFDKAILASSLDERSSKTILSVFVGGAFMAAIFNLIGTTAAMNVSPLDHLLLGGFAFGAVFMATDPVTSARTETGKYIYGFLIGFMAIFIRVLNPGYPEGMMLAILLLNVFAPLIDFYVVDSNIKRRLKRATK